MSLVISAFPASGKTTYFKNWHCNTKVILDSDSSHFSWIKDDTTIRNPDFPANYIKHIQDNIEKTDIIFVSSHDIVRKALKEYDIPYFLIFPEKNLKLEWKYRMENRGDNEEFVSFILNNWDKFIDDMESETFPQKVRLRSAVGENAITSTVIDHVYFLYSLINH